jgi:transcriptional regulator with XRE-family HTH domain
MTTWATYVARVARTDVSTEIAKATGINQSSIYRWLKEEATPTTAHAARFAQIYGRNVLEAFVAAGFLSAEEAGVPPAPEVDLTEVSAEELAREVTRRLTDDTPGASIHEFPARSGSATETSDAADRTGTQEAADAHHATREDIEREQQELTEEP